MKITVRSGEFQESFEVETEDMGVAHRLGCLKAICSRTQLDNTIFTYPSGLPQNGITSLTEATRRMLEVRR